MARLLDVEDIIIHDNYPHPSLVNTNTDALQQVYTTNAWKKLLYYISYHLQSSSRHFKKYNLFMGHRAYLHSITNTTNN